MCATSVPEVAHAMDNVPDRILLQRSCDKPQMVDKPPSHHARPQFTDRIAWVALAKRLVTKDEEAFSGWMMTFAG